VRWIRSVSSPPGIGRNLAARLHEDLGIATHEELEAAAASGRLASAGFGRKRLAGILDTLASRLAWVRGPARAEKEKIPVAELLDVDFEYRQKAAGKHLRLIAPLRFNPSRRAWLPALHTERRGRHYIALISNTARAHELGRTNDWVVLFHDGEDGEHRETLVTARSGPLRGRRIVRGREEECARVYAAGPGRESVEAALNRGGARGSNVENPTQSIDSVPLGSLLSGRDGDAQ
jgi:hypothetical protein